jgi:acyl-CoA synthetase (AMP-forming)/AMP-acid ligase II
LAGDNSARTHHFNAIFSYIQVDSSTTEQVTFTEFIEAVERLALRLQVAEGVQKGHYVAIALNNCIEFPIALLSVVKCGAVAAFVNPVYTPSNINEPRNPDVKS